MGRDKVVGGGRGEGRGEGGGGEGRGGGREGERGREEGERGRGREREEGMTLYYDLITTAVKYCCCSEG